MDNFQYVGASANLKGGMFSTLGRLFSAMHVH